MGGYDRGVVPNRESDRGKAFSKCTQLSPVGAFAKIPAMARNPLEKLRPLRKKPYFTVSEAERLGVSRLSYFRRTL